MWHYVILPTAIFICLTPIVYPWLFSGWSEKAVKYSDKIVGIDLGTTYSCVGVYRHGRVEIIANDQGNRITPSCVSFTQDGQCLVGEGAKNELSTNPQNTVYDVKRLIGRKMDDPIVQKDIKLYPFEVIDRENKPHIRVTAGPRGTKVFAPEEISALVLGRMKEIASGYLGEEVRNAVVTVPAYFNNAQRQATKDAGAIAGLNVIRIINEPTAAGIAYGLNKEDGKVVLVFDLGGGTFDVSVMKSENKVFKVRSTGGDTHLGGEDFDVRVLEFFIDLFKRKKGEDIRKDKRAVQKLKREVEKAKRLLSYQVNARVEVDSLYRGIDFSETLTKARFEELNMDLFRSTIETVRQLLVDTQMSPGNIDEVILVGGSTRIPKIREMLEEFFDGKEPYRDINPDEAVAYGAAVLGESLGVNTELEVQLEDVNALTLGVELVGKIMANIIPRNTALPTKMSGPFTTVYDNQPTIDINVYEGERPMTKDNHLLGSFSLHGIRPAPRGVPQIEIIFEIDHEGILKVVAEDKGSGSKSNIEIKQDKHKLSQEQIETMIREAEIFAEEDRKMKAMANARNELETLLYSSMHRLGHSGLSDEEKLKLTQSLEKIKIWLEKNQSAPVEEYEYQRQILEGIIEPLKYNHGRWEL